MIFQNILLQILYKLNNERTRSAAFHLLRGKRSGTTIQDVGIFRLHTYFGILPKLSRKKYDEEISRIVESKYIITNEEGLFTLTELGKNHVQQMVKLPFDGWHFRGNEHIFFARLSLVVQSLSHQRAKVMSFIPIQKDEQIQQWVRQFLITNHYQSGILQEQLFHEIVISLQKASIEEKAKTIVMNRLAGYRLPGVTWQQMSFKEEQSDIDIQLMFIACLHSWLNEILANSTSYQILYQIAEHIHIEIPLTSSASQTAQLYKKGFSIEQISEMRKLKISTIEDHFVEMAMNDLKFPIDQFITEQDIELVLTAVEDYNTRKLKVLHEVVPHLTYFQIRLVLARGEKL